MDNLSSFYVDPVSHQLALLNLMLCVYLCCRGLDWAARVLFRRDPPRKLNRSKLARSDGSKSVGRDPEG